MSADADPHGARRLGEGDRIARDLIALKPLRPGRRQGMKRTRKVHEAGDVVPGLAADIARRFGAAMVIGGALGLDGELNNKPAGLRTLGLVGMQSALAVVADEPQAEITQGPLGRHRRHRLSWAGVILHRDGNSEVHGHRGHH